MIAKRPDLDIDTRYRFAALWISLRVALPGSQSASRTSAFLGNCQYPPHFAPIVPGRFICQNAQLKDDIGAGRQQPGLVCFPSRERTVRECLGQRLKNRRRASQVRRRSGWLTCPAITKMGSGFLPSFDPSFRGRVSGSRTGSASVAAAANATIWQTLIPGSYAAAAIAIAVSPRTIVFISLPCRSELKSGISKRLDINFLYGYLTAKQC